MHSAARTLNSDTTTITVALAGNPNCGKTTLFNALTGLRQKVANYPGVTVEKKTGKCVLPGNQQALIVDLPGTYSLVSRSPDEIVAMEVLRGVRDEAPDVVVVVIDASNLQRNLYLTSQLVELGRPMVMALNMIDVAQRRGIHIDITELSRLIGIPVVPVVGHKSEGITKLIAEIPNAKIAPLPHWSLPLEMKEELKLLGDVISKHHSTRTMAECEGIAQRLLVGDDATDLAQLRAHPQVAKQIEESSSRLHDCGIDPMQADIESHYR